ncbi:MAG: hypothetical protein ACI3XG_07270, partial [Faecousia sp.]
NLVGAFRRKADYNHEINEVISFSNLYNGISVSCNAAFCYPVQLAGYRRGRGAVYSPERGVFRYRQLGSGTICNGFGRICVWRRTGGNAGGV